MQKFMYWFMFFSGMCGLASMAGVAVLDNMWAKWDWSQKALATIMSCQSLFLFLYSGMLLLAYRKLKARGLLS